MIDIHSHLLPGVDDGAQSIEQSVQVLARLAADGVMRLVCTPHLAASEIDVVPHERYAEIFDRLVAAAPASPALSLGWEIMLDVPGADFSADHLTLGSSRAVLVEFSRQGAPHGASDELARIRSGGRVPVVAHPERYWGCTPDAVRAWRRAGALIQTDATMLLGSGPMTRLAHALLAEGLVDCLASDNHGDTRSLRTAALWLEEIGASEQASILTLANPGRVLADQPILPVAPVVVKRSMLQRLRELMRRG